MNTVFQKGAKVLFYGDSITDAGRSRTVDTEWGRGYAARTARAYQALLPEQEIVFLNRGISGNTSADLLTRYEQDVLALQPDFVSVMIGINDTWHGWNEGHVIPHETTEANVRELLGRIRRDLPQAKILVLEPYLLDSDPKKISWHEDFEPKRERIRAVGQEMADYYIDLPKLFAEYMSHGVRQEELTADGVHPTEYGHAVIAEAWLRCVGVIQ